MKSLFSFILLTLTIAPLTFGQLRPADRLLLDSLIAEALENSHHLNSMEAKLAQDRIRLNSEKSSWFSGVQVGVQFFSVQQQTQGETTTTTAGILPSIGGTLQLNLHKLMTTPQRISIARQETVRTSESLQSNQVELERWMTLKYFEYVQGREQMALTRQILQAKEEQELLIRKKFERGEEKFSALLEVQNAILQLKETLVKHEIGKARSWAEIEIMTGRSGK